MKRIAEEEKRQLLSAIESLEEVIAKNDQVKSYNFQGLLQKMQVAFCDEITAMWQYFTAIHTARGQGRTDALEEYQQHLLEQIQHLQKIATRIQQLGGRIVLDLSEVGSMANEWKRIQSVDVEQQLIILIQAQRKAREYYQNIVHYAIAIQDWVTSDLFKEILQDETEHEFDLKRLIEEID